MKRASFLAQRSQCKFKNPTTEEQRASDLEILQVYIELLAAGELKTSRQCFLQRMAEYDVPFDMYRHLDLTQQFTPYGTDGFVDGEVYVATESDRSAFGSEGSSDRYFENRALSPEVCIEFSTEEHLQEDEEPFFG